jgi:hypothetical protein
MKRPVLIQREELEAMRQENSALTWELIKTREILILILNALKARSKADDRNP